MSWNSPGEFFAMGGYGFYVWGSYAVTAVCIAAELWWLLRRSRTLPDAEGLTERSSSRQS